MNIIKKIFDELERNDIRICHFKSNCNLDKSFQGKADFDVLIPREKRSKCAEILLKNGCKRFEPQYIGWYPGVENWLAFDEETGVLYHIHLHNYLASGKKLLKDYVLPWSDIILGEAIKSDQFGIYTSESNIEMILLLTRISIKATLSEIIKAYCGRWKMSTDMKIEFDWLQDQLDQIKFYGYIAKMFPDDEAEYFWQIATSNNITSAQFIWLQKIIKKRLVKEHWYGNSHGYIKSWSLRLIDLSNKLCARKLGALINTKKITTSGGLIIAFVGVDGSGKSTVSFEIKNWLNKKADCESVYMGEGDGKKNLFARVTRNVYHKMKKGSGKNNITKKESNFEYNTVEKKASVKQYIIKYIHALTIFSIAKDNQKKIIRMYRKKYLGGFTVLDRYPQTQIADRNDGPKLARYANNLNSRLIKRLSDKEIKLLSIADKIQPDLVFRLNTTPELSQKRKPDEIFDLSGLQAKIDELNKIQFHNSKIFDIDTNQSFENEILEIKRIIWNAIG